MLDQIGTAGSAPALSNVQIGDLLGGTMGAVMGIMVALFDRPEERQGPTC